MGIRRCGKCILMAMVSAAIILSVATVEPANFDRESGYEYPSVPPSGRPLPFKTRQYVVYKAVDAITIDGRLDETSWENAEWTNTFDHILSVRGYARPFLATRAKILWDDEKLYFAADMEEPNLIGYIAQHDTVVCYDNDFEIFIDVDDDAQDYIELEFNTLGTIFDIFYPKEFHRGGLPHGWPQGFYGTRNSPDWDLEGMRIAARVDGSLNYPLDRDRGWTLEVSIPWESLQKTSRTGEKLNREGSCFRVGMSRVEYPWPKEWPIKDWNDKGSGSWDWTWTPNLAYDMHVPEAWGRVILSERNVLHSKDRELENSFPFTDPPVPPKKTEIGSMVRIKGGVYPIGPDETDPAVSPGGNVTVGDFYIDRYEVTVGEYALFLNAGNGEKHYMDDMADPFFCGIVMKAAGQYAVVPGRANYPMVFMRPESASAYASWVGKRLPTEYEWEVAARGIAGRRYPWGNEPPDSNRANYNYHIGHTTPVGSFEKGKTPEGIYDLAGNVWELCDGVWEEYPWGAKVDGRTQGRQIMRGGSWITPAGNIGSAYRNAMKYSGWAAMIGFRCARDAGKQEQ